MSKLKVIDKRIFKLEDLRYQYIPKITLFPFRRSLPESPQVALLLLWQNVGWDWDVLMQSDFAEDRRHRFKNGVEKWTEKKIHEHIEHRISIYKSIKKHGFKENMSKNQPLAVLDRPLFGCQDGEDYYPEIYHGGRRCAAAYVLGIKELPMDVVVLKDKSKYERWSDGTENA